MLLAPIPWAKRVWAFPFLTVLASVERPVYEMGRIAAEILLQQMAGSTREHEEVKVKGQLIIRDTCGAGESQQTNRRFERNTSLRRVLLHKDPDN